MHLDDTSSTQEGKEAGTPWQDPTTKEDPNLICYKLGAYYPVDKVMWIPIKNGIEVYLVPATVRMPPQSSCEAVNQSIDASTVPFPTDAASVTSGGGVIQVRQYPASDIGKLALDAMALGEKKRPHAPLTTAAGTVQAGAWAETETARPGVTLDELDLLQTALSKQPRTKSGWLGVGNSNPHLESLLNRQAHETAGQSGRD